MAKMFLTGGNNGMWKRRKLSSIGPTYVDFELDPSTGVVTTEFDFNKALDILKNNGALVARVHVPVHGFVYLGSTAVYNFDENDKRIVFTTPTTSEDYSTTATTHAIYWDESSVRYKHY